MGQVRMFQKIQCQVPIQISRQISRGIIQDRERDIIYGNNNHMEKTVSVFFNTPYLFLTASVLLKNNNFLW